MKVNELGTEYEIFKKTFEEEPCLKENGWGGFCDGYSKQITVHDISRGDGWENESQETIEAAMKITLRHEDVHAFLNESGLMADAHICEKAWSKNEEMVDWVALQFPKILNAFQETNCL